MPYAKKNNPEGERTHLQRYSLIIPLPNDAEIVVAAAERQATVSCVKESTDYWQTQRLNNSCSFRPPLFASFYSDRTGWRKTRKQMGDLNTDPEHRKKRRKISSEQLILCWDIITHRTAVSAYFYYYPAVLYFIRFLVGTIHQTPSRLWHFWHLLGSRQTQLRTLYTKNQPGNFAYMISKIDLVNVLPLLDVYGTFICVK